MYVLARLRFIISLDHAFVNLGNIQPDHRTGCSSLKEFYGQIASDD